MKNRILHILLVAILTGVCIISCSKEEIIGEISISEGTDLYAEAAGEEITITVTANKEWSISSGVEWCKVTSSSGGAGTHKVKIIIDENTTLTERSTMINLTCDNTIKRINVTQSKYDFLNIKHNNTVFMAPKITGNGFKGKINWGDGEIEEYKSNSTHNYSSENTYTVQVTCVNAIEVKLENIQGIQELDLSQF